VGAGAAYLAEAKGERKQEMEIAIVGTEVVDGKPGYWMELAMQDPEQGQIVVKHLIVLAQKDTQIKKMIVQVGIQPPMEFPLQMMGQAEKATTSADVRDQSERVGTETVTTPAGTFTCEHWRTKAKDRTADVWLTEKVHPWGLVKMTSPEATMTLLRVVTDAKTRIKGTPQKFVLGEMMRPRPE
jgi:hypothetical protein